MIEINQKQSCCGCSACEQICPKKAILMTEDDEGFFYPTVNSDFCVKCDLCETVCPENKSIPVSENSVVFACYRSDFKKRLQSQSGGIFAVLAEYFLDCNGVVFGAKFNEDWSVGHTFVENRTDLQGLLGSKYIQSKIDNSYIDAKRFLENGRKVLFSGTPCQIQGLKKFLHKDYSNLITVDLICHGVPSNAIWHEYLTEFLGSNKLKKYIQKDKSYNNSISFHLENEEKIVQKYDDNVFIKGFNKNLYLRPSCYDCSFKGVERCSDITIGDFWGIEQHYPEFADQFGISAVIIHTNAGKEMFNKVRDDIKTIKASAEVLISNNPCLISSSVYNEKREEFFAKKNEYGIIKTVIELTKPTNAEKREQSLQKFKYQTRSFLGRIKRSIIK